ncbi:MAG: glycosyltransferase [Chitinophagaceae bacterium]
MRLKKICLTVTTDLVYDQRMIRICTSLAEAGYDILLAGRIKKTSLPLQDQPYRQKRLYTFFEKGKLFYMEYNTRLFFYLLTRKTDLFCAIDLDTILPVWLISSLKKKPRVYDAHELFCEMKEVVTRPSVYRIWKIIEKICVPKFKYGYTVNQLISDEFTHMYGVQYEVIRNVPFLKPLDTILLKEKFIIYQGSVNEGRSFETLIPAMQWIDIPLIICGDGNFMEQLQQLIRKYDVAGKVVLKGLLLPGELRQLTQKALIGITLFENNGKSNYLSLANRFFDYMHAGTPQLCVNYPAYEEINNQLQIAVVTEDLSPENIAHQINGLLNNKTLYAQLRNNCLVLRQEINWEKEKQVLILFYRKIFETVE